MNRGMSQLWCHRLGIIDMFIQTTSQHDFLIKPFYLFTFLWLILLLRVFLWNAKERKDDVYERMENFQLVFFLISGKVIEDEKRIVSSDMHVIKTRKQTTTTTRRKINFHCEQASFPVIFMLLWTHEARTSVWGNKLHERRILNEDGKLKNCWIFFIKFSLSSGTTWKLFLVRVSCWRISRLDRKKFEELKRSRLNLSLFFLMLTTSRHKTFILRW